MATTNELEFLFFLAYFEVYFTFHRAIVCDDRGRPGSCNRHPILFSSLNCLLLSYFFLQIIIGSTGL